LASSVQQVSSWKAVSCSAVQEIPETSWNTKMLYANIIITIIIIISIYRIYSPYWVVEFISSFIVLRYFLNSSPFIQPVISLRLTGLNIKVDVSHPVRADLRAVTPQFPKFLRSMVIRHRNNATKVWQSKWRRGNFSGRNGIYLLLRSKNIKLLYYCNLQTALTSRFNGCLPYNVSGTRFAVDPSLPWQRIKRVTVGARSAHVSSQWAVEAAACRTHIGVRGFESLYYQLFVYSTSV